MSDLEKLNAYLNAKDVLVIENTIYNRHKHKHCFEMDEIVNYFQLLSMFHKKIMGYNGDLLRVTGKEIENYKDDIRKLKFIKKNINIKDCCDEMDIYYLNQCEKYISKGEKYISIMYNSGFREILERSLERREICIGGIDNIGLKKDKKIQITNINGCCYDFFEMDAIRFLNKLKKHKSLVELSFAVDQYCTFEGFDNNSYGFIIAAMNFPYKIIHQLTKYYKDKGDKFLKQKFFNVMKQLVKEDEANNDD